MRILYITTVSCTINAFFGPHIKMLVQEGNQVDLASDFREWGMDDIFSKLGCGSYQIDFSRSPLSPNNLRAYKQLKKVVENGKYVGFVSKSKIFNSYRRVLRHYSED